MGLAAQKVTGCFLRKGLIEPRHCQWCAYMVEGCLTTAVSLLGMILLGSCVAPVGTVVTLNLGMLYLRPRLNGFHAKTFAGCLVFSALLELAALALLPLLRGAAFWAAFGCSLAAALVLGPFNHPSVHFSQQEMARLRPRAAGSVLVFALAALALLWAVPGVGRSMVMALNVTAFLLVLANLGLGAQ